MYFRFLIDETEYTEPIGSDDLAITVERNPQFNGLLIRYTNQLTFTGAAYAYLYNIRTTLGLTQVFPTIQYKRAFNASWRTLIRGVVNISDVRFVHFPHFRAELTIEDNGWVSFINNNKDISTYSTVNKTKNGEAITTVNADVIQFYNTVTGVDSFTRDMYQVDKLLNYIIHFMTDNKVDYESPVFGVGGELEGLYISTGQLLNNNAAGISLTLKPPYFSFSLLFTELKKKRNIGFSMDYSGTKPKMIVDYAQNLLSETVSVTLRNPDKITESFNRSLLYSKIVFGSRDSLPFDGVNSNYPIDAFIGWAQEEYWVTGQSNVGDLKLDLVGDWIADSNIINQVVNHANTDYDDTIFFVETDASGNAIKYDTLDPSAAERFYNLGLTNKEVALRYFGFIPNSIASYLNLDANVWRAVFINLTGEVIIPFGTGQVIPWDSDLVLDGGFDTGGNYDTALFRGSAPIAGGYSFHTNFGYSFGPEILDITPHALVARVFFRRYDSGGGFIQELELPAIYNQADGSSIYGTFFTLGFYMNVGDYVDMEFDYLENAPIHVLEFNGSSKSLFECSAAPDGGGRYQEFDTRDYLALNYDFKFPLTQSEAFTILENTEQRIEIVNDGRTFGGWAQKIEIKLRRSISSVTLLSKINKT